jgi:1,4-dihydroxy-2-naphthoate polyprenyltransferase
MNNFKVWMAQIRANFLILSVFLVLIGLALSIKYPPENGYAFNYFHAVLLVIGVVVAHISVNLFNEYSDYFTKIDFKTNRTPFSGGSGMMVAGKSQPRKVLAVALITLLFAFGIGIYFSFVAHWTIIIFAIIGAFSIVFYTNFLARMMLGELFAGLALGTLVVLGSYLSMTASPAASFGPLMPAEVVWLSIPPGILTALLLFINQFPDMEADIAGGRNHLVIRLGKKRSAWVYCAGMFTTFAIIFLLPIAGLSSYWIYLALFPIPLAVKASVTAIKYGENYNLLIPALGSNVITVLATDLLIAIAIFIEVL